MVYKPIRSDRLFEQIVDQIEERIINGELRVGDKLPSEAKLSDQFGVSRTAVREAMKVLSLQGYIDIQVGRGTFVTADYSDLIKHSLSLMIRKDYEKGITAVIEVREILEPEIAALAASRRKPLHIQKMREALEQMEKSLDDADKFVEYDLAFHTILAKATNNPLIPVLVDSIVDILREQRKNTAQASGGLERGQIYHKRILKAVELEDCDLARKEMQEHVIQVRQDSLDKRSPNTNKLSMKE